MFVFGKLFQILFFFCSLYVIYRRYRVSLLIDVDSNEEKRPTKNNFCFFAFGICQQNFDKKEQDREQIKFETKYKYFSYFFFSF